MNSILISLLLWLSKTDPALYKLLPTSVKWTRTGLGTFVLLTGIFAFITGSYFISTLFSSYNEVSQAMEVSVFGEIVSFLGALIWAFMIILIDREIVSAASKYSALIRLPLAIILGLTIAIPFKVKFFSDRINKELTIASRQENKVYEDRMNTQIGDIEEHIRLVTAKRDKAEQERLGWAAVREAEIVGRVKKGRTGKQGCGPACREAERNEKLHAAASEKYNQELEELKSSKMSTIEDAQTAFENSKIHQSYDFISQYERMVELIDSNKDLFWLSLLLTMVFILIETIPAIMKLLKDKDEYDILLEVRQNLNSQMALAYGNMALDEIDNANYATLSKGNFPFSAKAIIQQLKSQLS